MRRGIFARQARLLPALSWLAVGCTAPNPAYTGAHAPADALAAEPEQPPGPPPPDARVAGLGDASPVGVTATDAAPVLDDCGTARPDVSGIVGADALAVDLDGTIYFSQEDGADAWIGRLRPGAAVERLWVKIPQGLPTRGLALDTNRRLLYLTAGTASPVLETIDLTSSNPAPQVLATGLVDPNDIAIGPDGNAYVSDQSAGHIFRFTPSGARMQVTTARIGDSAKGTGPAGLAFAADGALFVGLNGPDHVLRIGLAGGVEISRTPFGAVVDWGNGLAFDDRARLYVANYSLDTDKTVVRLDHGGTGAPVTMLSGGRFSALAFGRGALNCHDLYVAQPLGPLRRIPTDATAGWLP